ncbi:MAG: class I SAM-dependent methyltransferase [Rickettsiaceae bacterium]|nr:class I SAM-dependent methyltransferase [Rickettsiaceae bacterium]
MLENDAVLIKSYVNKFNEALDAIPDEPEAVNGFVPTLNKQGYMAVNLDNYSQSFVSIPKITINQVKLLEIGAAYGIASLQALNNGAIVFANDIEIMHLAVLFNKVAESSKDRLIPVVGKFPDELDFPENYFDGILISRVMHFFNGETIVKSLEKLRGWVKPEGKIYIINETPYLSNWQKFIPEYLSRKGRGIEWPGIILDPKVYANFRSGDLPDLVHWLDHDTLKHAILKAGFVDDEIESLEYINRSGQFPDDMIMPSEGRESIGCCIIKNASFM